MDILGAFLHLLLIILCYNLVHHHDLRFGLDKEDIYAILYIIVDIIGIAVCLMYSSDTSFSVSSLFMWILFGISEAFLILLFLVHISDL